MYSYGYQSAYNYGGNPTCCNTGYGYPVYPSYGTGYGSGSAIILVLFILLVIVIGARCTGA